MASRPSMFSEDNPVLIIGAGVSGLVLAQGLKYRGIPFKVFERNESLTAQGYRFRCEAPGLEALEAAVSPDVWDLIEKTHPKGSPPINSLLDLQTAEKRGEINRLPDAATARDQRCYPIDRPWFLELLFLGIEDHVSFGKSFEAYELLEECGRTVVRVRFEDQSTATGRLLVAADGVRSRVRQQRFPELKQVDLGRMVCWGRTPNVKAMRSRLPAQFLATHLASGVDPKMPTRSTLFAPIEFPEDIPSLSTGRLSPRESYIYWVISTETNPAILSKHATLEDKLAWIDTVTADWNPAFKEMYAAQDPSVLTFSSIFSACPDLPEWEVEPRLAFLGDAIHAMSPTGGVGGRTAIEDAKDLCVAIASVKDGQEENWLDQLQMYERRMRARAAKAIEQSFEGGKRLWQGKNWWEYERTV